MILWFARAALAVTWWVDAPEQAGEVRAALDASWPGHAIDVQVGVPGDGDAIWVEDGAVVARFGGEQHRQSASAVEVQVVLVRSWARDLVVEDSGWIPAIEFVQPVVSTRAPEPPADGARQMLSAAVGTGLRPSGAGLGLAAIEGGVRVRSFGGVIRLEGLALETTDEELYGYQTRSGAVSFGIVGLPARAPNLSWSASVGVRGSASRVTWSEHEHAMADVEWTTTQPTARGALRWTEPLGPVRVGASVALCIDAPLQFAGPSLRDGDWPLLAAAELVVERR